MKDLVNFLSEGDKCECLLKDGAGSLVAAAASTCVNGGTEICRTNWTLSVPAANSIGWSNLHLRLPPFRLLSPTLVVSRVLVSLSHRAAKTHIDLMKPSL